MNPLTLVFKGMANAKFTSVNFMDWIMAYFYHSNFYSHVFLHFYCMYDDKCRKHPFS